MAQMRIGTRGSPLALAQARELRERLMRAHGRPEGDFEIVVIRTSGDAIQDRALSEAGGKGLFTKEIEEALLAGRIDLAVHSAKDMPTLLPDGLVLTAYLEREDVRDVYLSPVAPDLASLPPGAVVGTASLRRQALTLRLRPDLSTVTFRGNVQTRLRKLEAGEAHATLLAYAGLKRLGLLAHATAILDIDVFPPAVGQGAIAVETRADDATTRAVLASVDHADTHTALIAERAFLDALDGSCRTPIAGHARLVGGRLLFRGLIVRPDGSETHETTREAEPGDAAQAGFDAGGELKARGGANFFAGA